MMTDVQRSVTMSTGYTMPTIGYGVFQLKAALCPRAVEDALRTATSYYGNEAEVGQGLRNSGISRDQVFISGYYDLFLVHSPHGGRSERLAKYKALVTAKERGLIRTIGVSNYSEKHIREIEAERLEKPAVNQIEQPIVSYCKSEEIAVQAYTPLVRGKDVASGKGIKNAVVRRIAAKHGRTCPQVLIRWSLQKGFVPLPRATAAHRIEENFRVYDFGLDVEDVAEMDALDEGARGAVTWDPVSVR